MEYITESDYTHAERVCKKLEIKNLSEHHGLYAQSDTILLANVLLADI